MAAKNYNMLLQTLGLIIVIILLFLVLWRYGLIKL